MQDYLPLRSAALHRLNNVVSVIDKPEDAKWSLIRCDLTSDTTFSSEYRAPVCSVEYPREDRLALSRHSDIDVPLRWYEAERRREISRRTGSAVRKAITSTEIGSRVLVRRLSFEFRFVSLFPSLFGPLSVNPFLAFPLLSSFSFALLLTLASCTSALRSSA